MFTSLFKSYNVACGGLTAQCACAVARIDNFMKSINLNFYVTKNFPSKIIIIELFLTMS